MCEGYPTTRVGLLVQVLCDQNRNRVATFEESQAVLKEMVSRSGGANLFDNAVLSNLKTFLQSETAKDYGVGEVEWLDAESDGYAHEEVIDNRNRYEVLKDAPTTEKEIFLRDTAPQSEIPPIVDFSDLAFRVAGQEMILRCCVTICVNDDLFDFTVRENKDVHSKLWARLILIREEGKRARDLPPKQLAKFINFSEELCSSVVDSMREPYETVYRKTLKLGPQYQLEFKGKLSTMAVATDQPVFKELFRKLVKGTPFHKLMKKNRVAGLLGDLAKQCGIIGSTGEKATWVTSKKTSVLYYEDGEEYCGVFLNTRRKGVSRYIGVTHFPFWMDLELVKEHSKKSSKWLQPPYHVTSRMIREFGSEF